MCVSSCSFVFRKDIILGCKKSLEKYRDKRFCCLPWDCHISMVMKEALDTGLTKVIRGLPASLFHVTGRLAEGKGENQQCAQELHRNLTDSGLKILLYVNAEYSKMFSFVHYFAKVAFCF